MDLWSDLFTLASNSCWSVIGDFNAVLGAHEKTGNSPAPGPCNDFCTFMDDCLLSEIPTNGAMYTWTNGRHGNARVESKLDKALANFEFFNYWNSTSYSILPRHHSDHSPLLIHCGRQERIVSRFRFHTMWISHPDVRDVISRSWESPMVPLHPMQLLGVKLKRLRTELRYWN